MVRSIFKYNGGPKSDHATNVFKKVKMFPHLNFFAKRVESDYGIIRVTKAVDNNSRLNFTSNVGGMSWRSATFFHLFCLTEG